MFRRERRYSGNRGYYWTKVGIDRSFFDLKKRNFLQTERRVSVGHMGFAFIANIVDIIENC